MKASRRPRRLMWIASPFTVWGLHFVAVYSIQGLVCGRGWTAGAAWLGMGLATLPAFAAVVWIGLHARRQAAADVAGEKRFAARLVAMLSLLALVAMVLTTLPIPLLHPCQ